MKLFDVYPLYDIEPVKGFGTYVYDASGNRYLDLYGGHAVISIGHAHPTYVEAISRQVSQLGFYSNSVKNRLQQELADRLGDLSGLNDYQLFLINSGAEANENALKLASFHNNRTAVLALHKGFHGRTSAAVRATDNLKIQAPINRGVEVTYADLDDLDAIRALLHTHKYTAFIAEAIQGIGGIHIADGEALLQLRQWCRETDTVFISDEIQCGYGRSGRFFAFQEIPDLEPDIVTVAKGMGNGFPIGGVLIHPRFKAWHGMLGTTFGGSHLACAAGIAVLQVMEKEKLIDKAGQLGTYLMDALKDNAGLVDVRGRGLMIGIELDSPVAALRKTLLFEKHVFTGSASDPNVIRILPPLTIQKVQLNEFVQVFTELLSTTPAL